jgi:hypothetical protein
LPAHSTQFCWDVGPLRVDKDKYLSLVFAAVVVQKGFGALRIGHKSWPVLA